MKIRKRFRSSRIYKINKLRNLYFIQEYAMQKQRAGVPNTVIIMNLNALYHISSRSFYSYIEMNVRGRLRELGIDFENFEEQKKKIIDIIDNLNIYEK